MSFIVLAVKEKKKVEDLKERVGLINFMLQKDDGGLEKGRGLNRRYTVLTTLPQFGLKKNKKKKNPRGIPEHWDTGFEDEQQIRRFSRTPCHGTRRLYSEKNKRTKDILEH